MTNPNVRQSLIPESASGGTGELTFQISADSTNPTVIAGYDANGNPIEDTLPNAYWEWWVKPSGCIDRVVMRSASVFSNDYQAKLYEQAKTIDHIGEGQLPAWACPHTLEYRHIKTGPLVPGGEDCGGSGEANKNCLTFPKVCSHMQKVIDMRRAEAKRKHELVNKPDESLSMANAEKLMKLAGESFGQTMASHQDIKASARRGKVEE